MHFDTSEEVKIALKPFISKTDIFLKMFLNFGKFYDKCITVLVGYVVKQSNPTLLCPQSVISL